MRPCRPCRQVPDGTMRARLSHTRTRHVSGEATALPTCTAPADPLPPCPQECIARRGAGTQPACSSRPGPSPQPLLPPPPREQSEACGGAVEQGIAGGRERPPTCTCDTAPTLPAAPRPTPAHCHMQSRGGGGRAGPCGGRWCVFDLGMFPPPAPLRDKPLAFARTRAGGERRHFLHGTCLHATTYVQVPAGLAVGCGGEALVYVCVPCGVIVTVGHHQVAGRRNERSTPAGRTDPRIPSVPRASGSLCPDGLGEEFPRLPRFPRSRWNLCAWEGVG
jgi:hypothetical protein